MDLLRELFGYLRAYRRYWLIPLVLAVILVGALVTLSMVSPLSPFIYPLF